MTVTGLKAQGFEIPAQKPLDFSVRSNDLDSVRAIAELSGDKALVEPEDLAHLGSLEKLSPRFGASGVLLNPDFVWNQCRLITAEALSLAYEPAYGNTVLFDAVADAMPRDAILGNLRLLSPDDLISVDLQLRQLAKADFYKRLSSERKKICLECFIALKRAQFVHKACLQNKPDWPLPARFTDVVEEAISDILNGKLDFLVKRAEESGLGLGRMAYSESQGRKQIVVSGSVDHIDSYYYLHELIHYLQNKRGGHTLFDAPIPGDSDPRETEAYFVSNLLNVNERGSAASAELASLEEQQIKDLLISTPEQKDEFMAQARSNSADQFPNREAFLETVYYTGVSLADLASQQSLPSVTAVRHISELSDEDGMSMENAVLSRKAIAQAVAELYLANNALRISKVFLERNLPILKADMENLGLYKPGMSGKRHDYLRASFSNLAADLEKKDSLRLNELVQYWICRAYVAALDGNTRAAFQIIDQNLVPALRQRIEISKDAMNPVGIP